MRQQAMNVGTRVESKDVVKCVLKQSPFTLTAHDGQTVEARTVIIATGARANYLGLPSEEKFKNNGVSACAVCDGALPRFRGKPIVVVGAGDTAVEEAAYLSKFGSTVHLLVRRDVLRASKIMANRVQSISNIEVHWNSEVDEVCGDDKAGVTAVRVRNNKTGSKQNMPAAGLFLAIGHTPNVAFLGGQVELSAIGYVKWTTPARTYTSVEGVFAAGDVADAYYRQAVTASGTGCMAALDAERWLGHHGPI
jgi:thioredoxin reductase (NADPH)